MQTTYNITAKNSGDLIIGPSFKESKVNNDTTTTKKNLQQVDIPEENNKKDEPWVIKNKEYVIAAIVVITAFATVYYDYWLENKAPVEKSMESHEINIYSNNTINNIKIKPSVSEDYTNDKNSTHSYDLDTVNLSAIKGKTRSTHQPKPIKETIESPVSNTAKIHIRQQEERIKRFRSKWERLLMDELVTYDVSIPKKRTRIKLIGLYKEVIEYYKNKDENKFSYYINQLQTLNENLE